MSAWIMSWIERWQTKRKLTLVATADHVELTDTHLILGLKIAWSNQTNDDIPVKDIQVRLYLHRRDKLPLRFHPLERFEREFGSRAFQKTPVGPFTLPANEIHIEELRFICQEIYDIQVGNYMIEVQIKDTRDASYTSRAIIQLQSKNKFRRSEEWVEN
jgi:hypothetical protein